LADEPGLIEKNRGHTANAVGEKNPFPAGFGSKNLPLKFAFLAVLIVVCLWSVFLGNKLRLGIDLRGGHSLIFEIRTNEAEIKRLEADRKDVEAKLSQATGNEARAALEEQLARVKNDLARYKAAGADPRGLPEQMISTLKKRVDPQGLRSLEWRPLGGNRFEVRMPAGSDEAQQAKRAYIAALEQLEQDNVSRPELRRAMQLAGDARTAELTTLARGDLALRALLGELAEAYDAMQRAQAAVSAARGGDRTKAGAALDETIVAYETKLLELEAANVSPQRLQSVLSYYVSPAEAEAIGNAAEVAARRQQFETDLKALLERHPTRAAAIQAVVEKYQAYAQGRQRLDDPADLKRLIAKAGVLEFRIAPYAKGDPEHAMGESERDRYVEMLAKEGPEGARRRNERHLWFPLREAREKTTELVVADYAGRSYVLLSNQPDEVMLQGSGASAWSLKDAYPDQDSSNRPAVGFMFDPRGAKRFGDLTANHLRQVLAVLLDDEAYSTPVVESTITTRGVIKGNFKLQEVQDLVRTLQAGSLPARLNPDPVAENTPGPSIGAVNLSQALRAAYYSLIVVVAFMTGYYFLAGMVANLAMVLNVLLILGAMSLLNAVFTLPGIAGVILTIGMAVDANVLIYERLREEQAKGLSIRMGLKNAYERAFSAIFDSNITTLITSVILGWVGTEEVRGFAITLGLGVMFNLFTAVFVTRWVFQAMLDGRVLTSNLHMFKIIGVPKVNWMGLRHIFWAFSLSMVVMGVASLVWQGRNIWGIEFSAGTQAILTFKQGALVDGQLPNDGLVREGFIAQARQAGYTKLADTARVETVINPNRVEDFLKAYDTDGDGQVSAAEWPAGNAPEFFTKIDADGNSVLSRREIQDRLPESSYQVATTETSVEFIREVAAKAFGLALRQNIPHSFHLAWGEESVPALHAAVAEDGKTVIDDRLIRSANPALRDELAESRDGVLFVLTGISPSITRQDLLERIRQMRFQPDFGAQQFNRAEVLGLTPAVEGYSAVAVLVGPAEPAAVAEPVAWQAFVDRELTLLETALRREEAMVATNFDPAIAGETAQRAIAALVLSWAAIIAYLWLRFGSVRWGLAAVICLVHDVIIPVGLVAASGWLSEHAIGQVLGLGSFKIDLALVAALLTIVGYSVNDTIVVFDRIRENRGKLTVVTWRVINDSINQTLSRTLLTGTTTLFVVLIMYIWGGAGIHAFNFVLLVGILFGTYSSIAVAAPLLMGFRKALVARTGGPAMEP
ncbi:MAG: protein translocase subunit SecD, partial [Phycisphaerae bacterium]|nr:protein translocase subunit SecD [Phycisphaerae bacterium]